MSTELYSFFVGSRMSFKTLVKRTKIKIKDIDKLTFIKEQKIEKYHF